MDYEYIYFSDERKLMERIQKGPVATWFDVGIDFVFYGGSTGIYYSKDTGGVCGNNEVIVS